MQKIRRPIKEKVGQYLENFLERKEKAPQNICSSLLPYLKKKRIILTYSGSSLVEKTLIHLRRKKASFEVIACESRPALEGKKLAIKLAESKIHTTFMSDVCAYSSIGDVDILLCGADWVGKRFLINKIGTKAFFELGAKHKKKNWVFCEKDKSFSSLQKNQKMKEGPKKEICKKHLKFLKILNPYFERIPRSLVTHIFSN